MIKSIFIYRGSRYAIQSFGNGQAYEIADSVTGETAFLQDDDAAIFRDRLDGIEATFPNLPMDHVLNLAVEGAPFEGARV